MAKKIFFLTIFLAITFIFLLAGFAALPLFFLPENASGIYPDVSEVPSYEVGIVFGAGVKSDGTPTDALADRLLTAAELYQAGKLQEILVSGDNRTIYYNEPVAMQKYLLELGIPEDAISLDYAGRSTYETCARAHDIWGITEALLITQDFHLPRAMFTCNALGIESTGISASRQPYVMEDYYRFREWFAMSKAILDVYILKPDYVEGESETL